MYTAALGWNTVHYTFLYSRLLAHQLLPVILLGPLPTRPVRGVTVAGVLPTVDAFLQAIHKSTAPDPCL